VLGVSAGALIAHAFTGLLFGVDAVDVPTLAGVLGVLLATALLASVHPAVRAARVSPAPALAAE
jgi:ABC-type lipoprotein release transport system permease subunit